MENLYLVVAVAVLIEALVTYGQEIVQSPVLLITVGIGIVLSFIFKATIFGAVGININYYADVVLSGILMSRGSNYVYDFVGHLTSNKTI